MVAEAKAQEAAIETEVKVRFSIAEAKLKAEFKLMELSKCGLSVSSKSALKRFRSTKGSNKISAIGADPRSFFSVNRSS